MELDSKKKSRRDRMVCSNSFETQEVREIGRKEAGESRGFPILCMGIIDVFQMEGKIENVYEKILATARKMIEHEIGVVWANGSE